MSALMTAARSSLNWRRAKKDKLPTGTKRRVQFSDCGDYRLEEHRHGNGSVLYLAWALVPADGKWAHNDYWEQLGASRSKRVMIRACEAHRRNS